MENIFEGMGAMLGIIVLACIIVLCAMVIDLISGLHKAKQRHEIRSSWGLKRTLTKFITYEGGMMIAAGVDILIYLCHLPDIIHVEAIKGVPFITCLLGIFLLVVEFISVKEKADEKTKTEMLRVERIAEKVMNKDELVEALKQAIIESRRQSNESTDR